MRILHTSDWHLGRSFHREELLDAQAGFADHLLEVVRDQQVDLLVVAGDVYDRALPRVETVELLSDVIRRLAAAGVRTVISSGNHDSATRLGFAAEAIDAAGVHLRANPRRLAEPVVVSDQHGPVAVYAIPYLEPLAVRDLLGVEQPTHAAVLGAAMRAVRADLAGRGGRSVVLAHAFATGGEPSGSEREISVGGVSSVPAGVFDGVDYVALGHLHGPQVLADRLRYSGSPLPYSFGEADQTKSMWLVDLAADGSVRTEALPVPQPRSLARVSGELADLLTGRQWTPYQECYLQVTLTDATRPLEPMRRLRERFPYTLVVEHQPAGRRPAQDASYAELVRGRSEREVTLSFVEHVRGTPADADEAALLLEAVEACCRPGQTA